MCHVLRLPLFMAASKRTLDQMYDFRILNSEIIHLPSADGMIYGTLICFRNLTDLYQFPFFGTRLERCENIRFSFYTHISMITPVMVTSDCF